MLLLLLSDHSHSTLPFDCEISTTQVIIFASVFLTHYAVLIGTEQGPPAAVWREAGHLDLFRSVSLDALIGIQQASKGHTSTSLLLKTSQFFEQCRIFLAL